MTIKLYWCRGKGRNDDTQRNFGDYLSPLIISRLSGKKVEYSPIKTADAISIGSILSRLHKLRKFPFPKKITVWGTGAATSHSRFPSYHHYAAVRGKHSLELLNCKEKDNIALGDPGLLTDQLFNLNRTNKQRCIGIIPHYVDSSDLSLLHLGEKYENIKILSVYSNIESLLQEIKNCDLILSSSLHGLIVSDSLGVPNAWLKISNKLNDDFKFYDYYSIWNDFLTITPLTIDALNNTLFDQLVEEYTRPKLDKIKTNLMRSLPF